MKMPPNDKRQLPYGESTAIRDEEALVIINNALPDVNAILANNLITEQFCEQYLDWINSGIGNTIVGLDEFKHACYSNGTTEAFDKFYVKNKSRRFRCFKGEYVYHRLQWRTSCPNWLWLDDACLDPNDAVVISIPFSDTGNKHSLHDALLMRCDELGIPVLIDCAYYGICKGIEFNFAHSCITDIVFSLSKVFPVAHARIGMRLTRVDDDDTLFVVNKINYTNRIGAQLGIQLIANFTPDYIYDKYHIQQELICDNLNVQPSKTVLFGIGGTDWDMYNRGGRSNRLSFNKILNEK